jgi:hypothetical protein
MPSSIGWFCADMTYLSQLFNAEYAKAIAKERSLSIDGKYFKRETGNGCGVITPVVYHALIPKTTTYFLFGSRFFLRLVIIGTCCWLELHTNLSYRDLSSIYCTKTFQAFIVPGSFQASIVPGPFKHDACFVRAQHDYMSEHCWSPPLLSFRESEWLIDASSTDNWGCTAQLPNLGLKQRVLGRFFPKLKWQYLSDFEFFILPFGRSHIFKTNLTKD